MTLYDLSVLIPARNEQFLARTVQDLLEHSEAATEVIVVLDGAWADPPIPQHERVTIVYHPNSIGQRAAGNEAATLARGKYVAKCDAHCSFDQGWDRKMLEAFAEVGDDVTMVPVMRNLHAFSWRCQGCGKETYQGPRPEGCDACDVNSSEQFDQLVKWVAKESPQSTAYRFDNELRFKYFGELKARQEGDLVESMSLQGSFFMLTREKYFELGICDEAWGNWGQQGSEVALKTWLSGGRVLCNRRTWYSHLFRTQKGFSHPWGGDARSQQNAIRLCQDTFFNNTWPLQKYPLSWLVERFWPVPDWREEDLDRIRKAGEEFHCRKAAKKPTVGVVYYTDNRLDPAIMTACQEQLRKVFPGEIVSVSLAPIDFGDVRVVLDEPRGYLTMFRQILAGLEASTADVVFLAEHDILYGSGHHSFVPPDPSMVWYNLNCWHYRTTDGRCVTYEAKRLSQLCGHRDVLIRHYRERVRRVEAEGFSYRTGFEPGSHHRKERVDDLKSGTWRSPVPAIDIKHGGNLTKARWHPSEFRDQRNCRGWLEADSVPGWPALPRLGAASPE